MTNMKDGLGFEEVNQATATPVVNATVVSGADIVNAEGELQSVSIGSATATYGAKIQAGSTALGAGSNLWLEFPVAYSAAPIVVVTDMTTAEQALLVEAGSINAGSAYIEGPTASDEFSWIAVGI
ncbi:hypothetical protein KAI04_04785 [Candidatus Pacearchaeota archaeon]|nr:hypothetical protein [Candidatus Pacearchaeota archaeon]